MTRTWLITGVSSGFGRALAEAVLERGEQVAGTLRHAEQVEAFENLAPGRVKALLVDVTEERQVRSGVDEALNAFGQVDVLVNNAGYGLLGAVEETSDAEARAQLETNFFGALSVTRTLLPHFRERRAGHILNISSMGGFLGVTGFGLYSASKFALEGLSEALAQEVAPLGIKVTIVEPGPFRTNWAGPSMRQTSQVIDDYSATTGEMREQIGQLDGNQGNDPAKAAAAMIRAVNSDSPPQRLVLSPEALEAVQGKLKSMDEELGAWAEVSRSTRFDSVNA